MSKDERLAYVNEFHHLLVRFNKNDEKYLIFGDFNLA